MHRITIEQGLQVWTSAAATEAAFAESLVVKGIGMKLTIDTDVQEISIEDGEEKRSLPLYSDEAFDLVSRQWIRVGWNQRYPYTFTWLGRPIIQLPEDMIRAQEIIFSVKPDVIVETGVAHGGSLIYYASLLRMLGSGRVIGIDIEIRPHNRQAIEEHPLSSSITLIEGSSVDDGTVARVREAIRSDETVLVFLDSNHTKAHVAAELEKYAPMVSHGSYIVATDGVMEDLEDVPRGVRSWAIDNPSAAAREFAAAHPEFELVQPEWRFNESSLSRNVTHWPDAWLRRAR
jgi:cephalosporin hydroxylase